VCDPFIRQRSHHHGDSDFAQLVTGPVKVHDISKACLLEAGLFDPKVALLRKILSGDKSDNIPSIKPRLGPKTAIALSNDQKRSATIRLTVSEAFERNRTLIDLNAAPSELQYR
jgi:5'-3' exonuclease